MQIELLPALADPRRDHSYTIGWSLARPVDRQLVRLWMRRMGCLFFKGDTGKKEDQWMGSMNGQAVCCVYANLHDEESCGFPIKRGDMNLFLINGLAESGEELCREPIVWESVIRQFFPDPDDRSRRLVTVSPASDNKRRNALLQSRFRPVSRDRIDLDKIWYVYSATHDPVGPSRCLTEARSDQHPEGFFQQTFQSLQEGRSGRSVYHPVIAGQCDLHDITGYDCPVLHDRHLLDRADRQDAGIGRIDDGCEIIDTEHAQVGDGEGASFPI